MQSLSQIFTDYQLQGSALPAFNIDCFLTFQAVKTAVSQTNLPCLVQLSPNQDKFVPAEDLFLLVRRARIHGLPIFLNMDHGRDINRLLSLAYLGFDMLHFDASFLDFDTALHTTASFIRRIKKINPNCLIEAEFNHINLVNQKINPDSFTQPDQAQKFIQATGADLLAVSVGNLHGVNSSQPEHLDLSLLEQTHQLLPKLFLVLHGGSGIDSAQLSSAIKLGIVKINLNTDLRLSLKTSLKQSLQTNPSFKAYDYLQSPLRSLVKLAVFKLQQFGSLSHV